MGKIKILPPQIVNLIAAGEVVERPASILKEVMENSLDAGASYIRVRAGEGGKQLLQIEDDGSGMGSADAHLAFTQHATSKISTAYDLQNINSFGFRGEALASISSVADIEMHTKQEGEPATKITVSQSRINASKSPRAERGTELIISDLFNYTPARRKFLKSIPTELSHLQDTFVSLAIPNLPAHFEFWHNGKLMLNLPAAKDLTERLFQIWGNEVAGKYVEIDSANEDPEGIRISGQIGLPAAARADHKFQYIFVNNRRVSDRVIQKAITQAYQGLISPDQQPCYFLFIDLPPDQVDVNVHPRKLEVRFTDNQAITSAVYHTVQSTLEEHTRSNAPQLVSTGVGDEQSSAASIKGQTRAIKQALYFTENLLFSPSELLNRTTAEPRPTLDGTLKLELELQPALNENVPSAQVEQKVKKPAQPQKPKTLKQSIHPPMCFQLFDTYILYPEDQSLVVIDQHAASAQIIFERLQSTTPNHAISSPQIIELDPVSKQQLFSHQSILEQLGFGLSDFGGASVQFSHQPELSSYFDLVKFARRAANIKVLDAEQVVELIADLAAIPAPQPLTQSEMQQVISELNACQLVSGPAIKQVIKRKLSRSELERDFKHLK